MFGFGRKPNADHSDQIDEDNSRAGGWVTVSEEMHDLRHRKRTYSSQDPSEIEGDALAGGSHGRRK